MQELLAFAIFRFDRIGFVFRVFFQNIPEKSAACKCFDVNNPAALHMVFLRSLWNGKVQV